MIRPAVNLPHHPARIVDIHTHLGPFRNFHIPRNDESGVVAAMDALGIDVIVTSAHAAISADLRYGNNLVADAVRRNPGRILGYCVANPNYAREMEAELTRCLALTGFVGVKVHPELHGDHALDAAEYRPMWELAQERSLPVLAHTFFGGDGLEVFARLADAYPRAQILLGHAGQDFPAARVVELVRSHTNVWLDLSGLLSTEGAIEALVAEAPLDRILFGSDLPFMSGALQLGTLLYAQLTPEELDMIAYRNAETLLGLDA